MKKLNSRKMLDYRKDDVDVISDYGRRKKQKRGRKVLALRKITIIVKGPYYYVRIEQRAENEEQLCSSQALGVLGITVGKMLFYPSTSKF